LTRRDRRALALRQAGIHGAARDILSCFSPAWQQHQIHEDGRERYTRLRCNRHLHCRACGRHYTARHLARARTLCASRKGPGRGRCAWVILRGTATGRHPTAALAQFMHERAAIFAAAAARGAPAVAYMGLSRATHDRDRTALPWTVIVQARHSEAGELADVALETESAIEITHSRRRALAACRLALWGSADWADDVESLIHMAPAFKGQHRVRYNTPARAAAPLPRRKPSGWRAAGFVLEATPLVKVSPRHAHAVLSRAVWCAEKLGEDYPVLIRWRPSAQPEPIHTLRLRAWRAQNRRDSLMAELQAPR